MLRLIIGFAVAIIILLLLTVIWSCLVLASEADDRMDAREFDDWTDTHPIYLKDSTEE